MYNRSNQYLMMNSSDWRYVLNQIDQSLFPNQLAPIGQSPLYHQMGDFPLLISAPHSTVHRRNGRFKRKEGFTAAIAHLIAQETQTHALYAQYRLLDDPNWSPHTPYKSTLRRLIEQYRIKFVIDLHGMSDWNRFGIAVGTINGRSCPPYESVIQAQLAKFGFTAVSETDANQFNDLHPYRFVWNHSRFTGGVTNQTITRFVTEKLSCSALQIELSSTCRIIPEAYPQSMVKSPAIQAIKMIISLIEQVKH